MCLLKESLYVLKYSPRLQYKKFDDFLRQMGFQLSSYLGCVYILKREEEFVFFLPLYLWDILIASQYRNELEELQQKLNIEFKMKDLGLVRWILGMEIYRDQTIRILRLS